MGKPSTKKKIILKKVKPVPHPVNYRLTKRDGESLERLEERRRRRFEYLQSPENLARKERMRQTGHLRRSREYRSYEDAQKFVKKLKLKSRFQWREYRSSGILPKDLPSHPNFVYESTNYLIKPINRQDWVDYETWLGLKPIKYQSFEDARKFARSLKITSIRQWKSLSRAGDLPYDVPQSPNMVYDEFRGWYDFFGHDKNTIVDRKLRYEYRILFDRQISYFQNLNNIDVEFTKALADFLNLDDSNYDDLIYNKMKSSLPTRTAISNSQLLLAEFNSYGNIKKSKFLEHFKSLSPKKITSVYELLEKNSIRTFGDLINSNSLPEFDPISFSVIKMHCIFLIFGNKSGNAFRKYLKEYVKIHSNYLKEMYEYDDIIIDKLRPLIHSIVEIKSNKKINPKKQSIEITRLLKKILKIIDKIKMKKYQIDKTKRTKPEIKILDLKWTVLNELHLYNKMIPLGYELLTNTDFKHTKNTINAHFAEVCLRIGKINKSLFYNQNAINSKPDDVNNWYNKACIHGVCGDVDFACNSLLVAISLGGNEIISDAKKDTDFSKIKDTEQFKKIIKSNQKKLFNL